MSETKASRLETPIQTPRLLLKDLSVADAEALFQYRSLPEVIRFQGWAPTSVEDAIRFITEDICHDLDKPDTWFQLGIFLGDEKTLIGDLGIHFLPEKTDCSNGAVNDDGVDVVEIGITVAPVFQSKGFAKEAVGGVMDFLFNELHKSKVVASVDPENKKSMALMAGIGFTLKGIYKNAILFRGEWADDAVFEMTAKQWQNHSKPNL